MVENTLNWYNGEIFEAKIILAFGLIIIIMAFLFQYLGNTPYAKALLIPLLITGVIFSVIGGSMIFSNQKKNNNSRTKFYN